MSGWILPPGGGSFPFLGAVLQAVVPANAHLERAFPVALVQGRLIARVAHRAEVIALVPVVVAELLAELRTIVATESGGRGRSGADLERQDGEASYKKQPAQGTEPADLHLEWAHLGLSFFVVNTRRNNGNSL